MDDLFSIIEQLAFEILPELISVVILSAVVFLIFLVISYHTKNLIRIPYRGLRPIWYLQTALFFSVVIASESIAYSSFGLDAAGLDLLDKTSQTLLWLLGAFTANQALHLRVWEGIFLHKYKSTPPGLLTGLAATVLYLVAIYGIMTFTFERPMTGLIVSSGIVAGVLGLAMQGSLSDLVAGVSISVERSFKIGDWIELDDGTVGEVFDINWRATSIKSQQNSLYILPNARISNARIHNYSRPEKMYGCGAFVHIPSTVAPSLVRRVLLQAALESEKVLVDPAPVVRVKEAGSSYKYMVFAYFESYPSHLAGLDDLFMHVWVQCARHGIVPSAVTSEIIVRKGVAEEIKGPSPNDLLAQVELFSKVDESSRQVLVSNLKVRTVPMGKEVVCHGEEGTSLYIVSAGMVRVIINNTPEGDMREVAKLGVGEYFGEESLLSEEPSTITVAAHTDCQLLEVDKESMKSVFDSHPELMHVMAQIMTERRLSNEESTKNLSEEDFTSKLNDLAGNLVGRMKKIF